MNAQIFSLMTETYLTAEWSGSRGPWVNRTSGPFVTISREAGTGGASLARLLARKLNRDVAPGVTWNVFDTNLTPTMLRAQHLPVRIARYLPEDRVSEVEACIGELVGLHPSLWDLMQKTNETMRQLAVAGHAILVGRGANFATRGVDHGVNVRLVAPASHRAAYLSQLYNISETEAFAHNAKCDAARRRYVKVNFGADIEDPKAYDLVINTAQVPLVEAANLVETYLRLRTPAVA